MNKIVPFFSAACLLLQQLHGQSNYIHIEPIGTTDKPMYSLFIYNNCETKPEAAFFVLSQVVSYGVYKIIEGDITKSLTPGQVSDKKIYCITKQENNKVSYSITLTKEESISFFKKLENDVCKKASKDSREIPGLLHKLHTLLARLGA